MTAASKQLISTFRALPEAEKREVAATILRWSVREDRSSTGRFGARPAPSQGLRWHGEAFRSNTERLEEIPS